MAPAIGCDKSHIVFVQKFARIRKRNLVFENLVCEYNVFGSGSFATSHDG